MINLLIRQNRLLEVNRKINEKEKKNEGLEDEIRELEKNLEMMK
jgi:hypothetical protein